MEVAHWETLFSWEQCCFLASCFISLQKIILNYVTVTHWTLEQGRLLLSTRWKRRSLCLMGTHSPLCVALVGCDKCSNGSSITGTEGDRISYTCRHVRRFLRRDEPFQGEDSQSKVLAPEVLSWEEEEVCRQLCHFYVRTWPEYEMWQRLPRVAQVIDSWPRVHSLSGCSCYLCGMGKVS